MARIRPTKNTHFIVKNLNGTSGLRCNCGNWLAHWRNASRSYRAACAVLGCGRPAGVGAHVRSVDRRTDVRWWIAPFCKYHNHYRRTEELYLDSRITLVSANMAYTCR
jgi:hypothetical protein